MNELRISSVWNCYLLLLQVHINMMFDNIQLSLFTTTNPYHPNSIRISYGGWLVGAYMK